MVDKYNQILIKNVSEETHRKLRILAAMSGQLQGEVLEEALVLLTERYEKKK